MDAGLKGTSTRQASQVEATILVIAAQLPLLILTLALADQSSSSILSEVALAGNSSDSDSPLIEIAEDATFWEWRTVRELVERTLLPMELGRMEGMSLRTLSRNWVTVMHQVPPWLILVFLLVFLFLFAFS